MRRVIALATVAAALALGATSATAARPTPQEQGVRHCGGWSSGPNSYSCQGDFTERDLTQARRLCERNGGLFVPGLNRYDCYLSI